VLSAIPLTECAHSGDSYARKLAASARAIEGRFTTAEIASWFTELKCAAGIDVRSIPLRGLPGWRQSATAIHRDDGRFFSVVALEIEAPNREVPRWSQPIVRPCAAGTTAFVTGMIDGVLHFLVQARMEPGAFDMFEMAPTVQHLPGSGPAGEPDSLPPFHALLADASAAALRHRSIQSEEGGRFYHFQNHNIVVEHEAPERLELPRGYIWMTLGQVAEFLRYNNYFNIEARGLLACLGVPRG
jgi:oxidase EvaA